MDKEQEITNPIVNDSNLNPRATPFVPRGVSSDKPAISLNVAFLNVCSLRYKVEEVQQFLAARGIAVLALAETWLKPDITDGELVIPNYRLYRKDRLGQQGGGVAIYYHNTLQVRRRRDLEDDALEVLWIEIKAGKDDVLLGSCYRAPDQPAAYWNILEANLETAFSGRQAMSVIVGDFNVDFTDGRGLLARPLQQILARFGLTNHVKTATRVTSRTATMLDLFLSTCALDGVCETVYLDLSDHFAILGHLPAFPEARSRAKGPRKRRHLHRIQWESFQGDLRDSLRDPPAAECIDDFVLWFTNTIISVMDKHAPLTVVRRKKERQPCPWLTDELVSCVRDRNRLHRLLMRDKANDVLREQHRAARAKARKLDRKLKNLYFVRKCCTTDQRALWSVMNVVTGRRKQRQEAKVSVDDLSKLFADVVHDASRPPELLPPNGPLPASCFSSFEPVLADDVTQCLRAIDPRKATGSDCIPGIVLKQCASELAPSVAQIINLSISSGRVPATFKQSDVSPLFKGGDSAVPGNYRPVSLLPIVSRILEHFVKLQLVEFLQRNNLYPPTQFAYRKLHSTEDALVSAVNRWIIAKSERMYTGVAMIDMSKAFDRVQHSTLINNLFNLGIGGIALLWFCNYLENRTQRVKMLEVLSDAASCTRGVPQGSVLGPLLFVLYTRNFHNNVPTAANHQEFADDLVIDCSHHDPAQVSATLTAAVTNVSQWLADIGLLLNAKKTQILLIRPRGASADTVCEVLCGSEKLATTKSARYLGVTIDDELSWRPHVDHVARKTAQAIGQLWRHGRSLSLVARRTWYISMIQSQLCYASNCYFPSITASLLDRLIRISKAGARAILRQPVLTPTEPLLARLHLSPLLHLLKQKILIFVHRCLSSAASVQFNDYYQILAPTPGAEAVTHRVTRGQQSRLLQIPFFRGSASRLSIQAVGSSLWNDLPVDIRRHEDVKAFKSELYRVQFT